MEWGDGALPKPSGLAGPGDGGREMALWNLWKTGGQGTQPLRVPYIYNIYIYI